MTPDNLPPILIYGLCRWDYITNRPQNLARKLADHTQVIYIDPPIGAGEQFPDASATFAHMAAPVVERATVEPGIDLIKTRWRYPFPAKVDAVARRNIDLLGSELAQLARSLPQLPALWVMYPVDHRLLEKIPHSVLVYDLVDRHTHFSGQSASRLRSIERSEEWLFKNADAVSVTAKSLGEFAASEGARNIVSIPNGCDYDHFSRAAGEPRHAGRPTIGFVGALGEWIDFEAIESVARAIPHARVLLAGPFHHPVDALPEGLPDNVEYLGKLDYQALPEFLASLDLTLVPFVVSDLTQAVNPVKVYEYLAVGKPVLATPLPELDSLGSVVAIKSAEEWASAAGELLAADSGALVAERLEVARANSWAVRAQTAVATIRDALARRRAD